MNLKQSVLITFLSAVLTIYGQSNLKNPSYFADPILVDSASTLLIPTLHNVSLFSFGDDCYANVVFYNFKSDSSKKLFKDNTYIISFNTVNYSNYTANKSKGKAISSAVFYRIKNVDHNKNGRIDSKDPSILYVSDTHGNNLKTLTTPNENVVSVEIYEKQNFALIKVQRDFDNDGSYESDDKDFYFQKIDLTTLTLGKNIELQ